MTSYVYEFFKSSNQWACTLMMFGYPVDVGFGATKEDARAQLEMLRVA